MSLLIIERGPNAGERIPLNKFPINIGRDPSNDLVLVDEEVSRFHLRMKQRGRLVVVEDLESRNGTYINGDRVINSVIRNGDRILVGSTEFTYVTSEPDIEFANEILNFNMVIAEQLGLKGPIDVSHHKGLSSFKPIRLNINALQQAELATKDIKTIYEVFSDLLVIDELEEASKSLLKSLNIILPTASRAAFFLWSDATRQLLPTAARQMQNKLPFILSQRALEDVINRKQGLLIKGNTQGTQASDRDRIILPMIHNGKPICILHVEIDSQNKEISDKELEMTQILISRCAPLFESMLLRKELDTWLVGMIETMIATVEAKDTYTRGHSERVSRYCVAIADQLKLKREIKKLLMISALCHDIGKIGIPDAILKKASLLSAEEYNEMKLHPSIGAEIVSHMPNAKKFISGIKYHHEKWDGTGYPDGLIGEDIPFFARIVGLADVFDAMVSGRSYAGFMDQSEAVSRLHDEKELFDPEILKSFTKAYDSGLLTLKTSTQNQLDPENEQKQQINIKEELVTDLPKKINVSAKKRKLP